MGKVFSTIRTKTVVSTILRPVVFTVHRKARIGTTKTSTMKTNLSVGFGMRSQRYSGINTLGSEIDSVK